MLFRQSERNGGSSRRQTCMATRHFTLQINTHNAVHPEGSSWGVLSSHVFFLKVPLKTFPIFFLFSPPCISETSQAEDKADSWLVFLAGKWTCIYIALLSRPTLWSTCHIKPFAHRHLTCRVFHLSISGWAQGHWILQFSHQWTAALPPDPRHLLRAHQQ